MLRRSFAVLAIFTACAAGCTDKSVKRADPKAQENVTMEMGLTEVQETAEEMKNEIANFQFPAEDVALYKDGRVRVRVLSVDNRTSEHFDIKILTDKIRKTMLNSGKIVVAEKENLAELQQERDYQDAMAKKETAAKTGNATGARYALVGKCKAIKKQNEDVKLSDYIFTLDLVNVETEETLLTAEKEIRKVKNR